MPSEAAQGYQLVPALPGTRPRSISAGPRHREGCRLDDGADHLKGVRALQRCLGRAIDCDAAGPRPVAATREVA